MCRGVAVLMCMEISLDGSTGAVNEKYFNLNVVDIKNGAERDVFSICIIFSRYHMRVRFSTGGTRIIEEF